MNKKVKFKFVSGLLFFWFSAVAINFVGLNPPVVNFVSGALLAASLWFIMTGVDSLVRIKADDAVAREDTSLQANGDQAQSDAGNDSAPVSIDGLRFHPASPLREKKDAPRTHVVDGFSYLVEITFPDTPDGLRQLNEHLRANPSLSVLDRVEGEWLVVDLQATWMRVGASK